MRPFLFVGMAIASTGGCGAEVFTPAPDGLVEPEVGRTYHEACDGSGAVALGPDRFAVLGDEDQVVRVYARGVDSRPLEQFDTSSAFAPIAAVDFEDAARIGNQVFVIGSHARDATGTRDGSHDRFAALTLDGGFTVAGQTTRLLADLLDATTWDTPDVSTIAALRAASQLETPTVPELAVGGTNIEGLAYAPSVAVPARTLIGLRSPLVDGRAIVASLLNAEDIVSRADARAHFGEASLLDLGGLGIRGMAWSEAHASVLVLAGPPDDTGSRTAYQLFRWSGGVDAPQLVAEVPVPAGASAEAIVAYPGSREVQIILDMGDVDLAGLAGLPCRQAAVAERWFQDLSFAIAD